MSRYKIMKRKKREKNRKIYICNLFYHYKIGGATMLLQGIKLMKVGSSYGVVFPKSLIEKAGLLNINMTYDIDIEESSKAEQGREALRNFVGEHVKELMKRKYLPNSKVKLIQTLASAGIGLEEKSPRRRI